MKKTGLYIFFLVSLLLGACNSQPFPGCCGPTGTRDVPFLETFLFDFRTGAGPITKGNPDGNLQIVSVGDLLTLLAAAQDTQKLGLGVVSGLVLYNGAPVQDVALKVTDADGRLLAIRMEGKKVGNSLVLPEGTVCPPENVSFDNICIRGSVYYNSPGGVPDFANNKGTSTEGTFTIFNLPPGDIYIWAARGGRGNSRIKVFADHISVGKVPVIPIAISTVGINGSVLEAEDESTAVRQAQISILGLGSPDLTVTSDSDGLYAIASVGTNGDYLMKVTKSSHWNTYHPLNTTPFQVATNIQDVTKTVDSYSNSYIEKIANTSKPQKISIDPSKGILTGRIKAGDGTPQHCATIEATDSAGNDLLTAGAAIVYVDGLRDSCFTQSANQTSLNGLFFIFNVPPGEVFLKFIANVSNGASTPSNVSGGAIATSFPGVVFVQDIVDSGSGLPQELSGLITDDALLSTKVPGAHLNFLGLGTVPPYPYDKDGVTATFNYPSDAVTKSDGTYVIPKPNTGQPLPLVGGTPYRVKISNSGFADTYQSFNMVDSPTKQNLLIVSKSLTSDNSKGEIYGSLIDKATGKSADVTISVTDLNGVPLGGEVASIDGTFRISNLPPGLVNLSVVSGDDSGNTVTRVYPNGVTYLEFVITKVVPAQIAVSGAIHDLINPSGSAGVDQAQLKVLGRTDLIAGGSGSYSANLESYGRFVIKSMKAGSYDTYNFFPGSGTIGPQAGLDLFSISRDQINTVAANAGIAIDGAKGIIAGSTLRTELSQDISSSIDCPATSSPHYAISGFFNRDAYSDIAITNCEEKGKITILFGNKAGGFTKSIQSPVAVTNDPASQLTAIVTGDFNGDGNADFAVANQDNTLSVLLGDKNGNFTTVSDANGAPATIFDQAQPPAPMGPSTLSSPIALAVGLFDSDTLLDIAVVNQGGGGGGGSVVVLLGNGNGTFHPVQLNNNIVRNTVGSEPKAIVAGDFNQDNRLDMAISNSASGTVSVFLGSTDGTFQPLSDPTTNSPIVIETPSDPQSMALVDLNADGRLDLVVAHPSIGKISIFIGNNSGGFDLLRDASGNPAPLVSVGILPSAISIGEFNGDGRVDLAVVNKASSDVSVLFGNGDGTFIPLTPILLGLTDPESVLLGDVDRNGLFDLTIIGSKVVNLLGKEDPVPGVSVEARNFSGDRVGTTLYLDVAGNVTTASSPVTTGFVILNVPPDIVTVRSTSGAAGNSIINVIPDSVSYAKVRTVTSQPFIVTVSGVTYDPVGPPPAGVPVGPVNIQLLGSNLQTRSDRVTGDYSFNVDANSEYVLRLFFDTP